MTDREVLSANSENGAVFNIGSGTCLRDFGAKAVHWKALQSKTKQKNACFRLHKIYQIIIHPRLNFMHFIISNTKKVSSFVFELCICLPRNRMTYVCVCGVKTAIDRVKGFSSGCFGRGPR